MEKVVIQNSIIKAEILKKGAELFSLEKDGKNYIWDVDSSFWNKTSPILFPIVGGLKNDEYWFEDQKYNLSRHGFARDYDFEILNRTENSVVFSLKFNDETLKVYPFEFEFQISYQLEASKLIVEYVVINHGNKGMLYSIGAHPAFKIEHHFDDYSLKFDHDKTLISYQLEDNLFNGKTIDLPLKNTELNLNYQLFDNDAIVLKNYTTTSLKLLYYNQKILKVNFNDFPYLGIWTKKEAPFICIEPWQGIADNANASGKLEEKEGICRLDAKKEKTLSWSVELF